MKKRATHPIDSHVATFLDMLQLQSSKCIIVALSGGPDSVALLLSIKRACDNLVNPPQMLAAHCNFQLRGAESERDEEFVAFLTGRLGIQCICRRFDTYEYCSEHNLSIEMGARELRHEWFADLCRRYDALLATGHNADDNAETMLLNMLRGSGVRGLKAMLPHQRHIIRPLLSFHRSEIIEYLDENGSDYVTDSTNRQSYYSRNFIRNEVMPLLRSKFPGADRGLQTTLRCLAEDNMIVETHINQYLPNAKENQWLLSYRAISESGSPTLLIYRFIEKYGGTPAMAEEIARAVENPRIGAGWNLKSKKYKIVLGSDGIYIVKIASNKKFDDYICDRRGLSSPQDFQMVRNIPLTECALPQPLEEYVWKRPETGMRIRPLGMKGRSRLVSDVILDAKLDPQEKEDLQILCHKETGEPIWIPGIKRSMIELITEDMPEYYHIHP